MHSLTHCLGNVVVVIVPIQDPRHVNRLPAGVHELIRRVLHSNFRELPTSMHFADAVVSTPANTFQPFPSPGT